MLTGDAHTILIDTMLTGDAHTILTDTILTDTILTDTILTDEVNAHSEDKIYFTKLTYKKNVMIHKYIIVLK